MFESHDAASNQTAGTTDNTSSILSTLAFDSMKDMRPYPKPDFKAMSEQPNPVIEMGAKNVGAVGDGGNGRGCALPSIEMPKFEDLKNLNRDNGATGDKSKCATPDMTEPGVRHDNPNPRPSEELTQDALDRMETEMRLYELTPKDDSTYGQLSRELNHAFVSGDLKDFTDVLNKTDDVKLREQLVNDLDQRLEKLEMDLPGETDMNAFPSELSQGVLSKPELNLYGEMPGKSPAIVIDMETLSPKAVEGDVERFKLEEHPPISIMKPIGDIDANPADLFRSLTLGEVKSIARNNAPIYSPLSRS